MNGPRREPRTDRVRDFEFLSEQRRREVDLVTDHQIGRVYGFYEVASE